ncbi:DUF1801 domain-containing protein [Macrococcus brunensis]|uniref:DUF1801 domain-containing protein n=1 Tax=Macrococcus brunensis TaxID=198483 RepID=A0A4R6BG88_9STAP|nr:DUF1801 domain-containing protein [Macrococcus brunensis]TDL98895.1 DUF1801 domain-containing protein [Macrococcus brunensis]
MVDVDRLEAFPKIIEKINQHTPREFTKMEDYGGVSYVVPHSIYPAGYHCTPEKPLPFLYVVAQKKHIAIYHMGLYADVDLLKWFQDEYAKRDPTKLNMGKSCIRFTNIKKIPYDLIGELAGKMSAEEWIERYDTMKKSRS